MTTLRGELVCPIVVGRDEERAFLVDALERAMAGSTQAIFLVGEAGVGKSRLCRLLLEEANKRGLSPLLGQVSSQDRGLPFGPVVTAIERVLRRAAADRFTEGAALRASIRILAPLFPDLATYQPNDDPRAEAPEINAALQRRRIFEALATALFALADRQPAAGALAARETTLVLVLEDLHWADESTVDFIHYLLQRRAHLDLGGGYNQKETPQEPGLLLIATYRPDDHLGHSVHPFVNQAVTTMRASRLAREITLSPLNPVAHAAMLAATLGQAVPTAIAHALYQHSDGNPFVTEELLAVLVASGQWDTSSSIRELQESTLTLPLSLRAAVLARLEGLGQLARRILPIAAVIGREFEFSLLQQVSDIDELDLLEALREGVSRQILVEESADPGRSGIPTAASSSYEHEDRFRFRHALTRDAVDGELLAPERRRLHKRVAETLERLVGPEMRASVVAGRLAHHFLRGGDPVRAQPYAKAASSYALRVGALAEAADHLDRAITTLPEGDPQRVALLELEGNVRLALMEAPRAAALLWQARSTAQATGLRWRAAAIGSDLAFLTWFTDPAESDREWIALLVEAKARLASAEAPDEAAVRLYAAASMCCGSNDQHRAALAWAERAVQAAALVGENVEPLLFLAYVGRGMAHADMGKVEAGVADLHYAIDLGHRYAITQLPLAYNVLIMALHENGRDAEALAIFAQACEYEKRTGAVVAPPPILYSYLALGRMDEGSLIAQAQVEGYGRFGIPTTPQGLARAGRGHFLERQDHADDALSDAQAAWEHLRAVRDFAWAANCLWGLARAYTALDRHAEAAQTYQQCLEWWRRTEDTGTVLPILLDAFLLAIDRQDLTKAQRLAQDLERLVDTGNPVAKAAALQAQGQLSLELGQFETAETALRVALELWRSLNRPFAIAGVQRALAKVILASTRDPGRRSEADDLLIEAENCFGALGATAAAEKTQDVRRRSGLLSQSRRRTTMEASRAGVAGLTSREREVLQCLVDGKTNREIAADLFIAESTAELHVSRILGKLGCATRAQAAALATAQGWAAPTRHA